MQDNAGLVTSDWLRYNAQYADVTGASGFGCAGANVKIHCTAIIPHPDRVRFGSHVRIDAGCILSAADIEIGDFVHIGAYTVLSGRGKIAFDDFSAMSHHAQIFTSTDDLSVPALTNTTTPIDLQALITGDVTVQTHAIIGAGSIVMPGVTLGMGSVVGAMSLVKDNVRPYSIVGGVPAAHLKERVKHISADALYDLERRCRDSHR